MPNSVHVHISSIPIAWLLSSYCADSEAINLRDPVIFIRTVQPWPPVPRKGEDTEMEHSKWLNALDSRTWERVCDSNNWQAIRSHTHYPPKMCF